MRLIDADKLIRIYFDDDEGNKTFEFVPSEFLDSAPTVDAVEVVRCKDCRHNNKSRIIFGTMHRCSELNQIVSDDFFCANAERRTE